MQKASSSNKSSSIYAHVQDYAVLQVVLLYNIQVLLQSIVLYFVHISTQKHSTIHFRIRTIDRQHLLLLYTTNYKNYPRLPLFSIHHMKSIYY